MPVTLEDMIDRIDKFVTIRMIGIAKGLAEEFGNEKSQSPLMHSGYAILAILMSYFEMIEQFATGAESDRKSKLYFRNGFKRVYPATPLPDEEIDTIYSWVRCGMYHHCVTKNETRLSRQFAEAFGRHFPLMINPKQLVLDIDEHFKLYVAKLRTPNAPERVPFEALCRLIGVDKEIIVDTTIKTTQAYWFDD